MLHVRFLAGSAQRCQSAIPRWLIYSNRAVLLRLDMLGLAKNWLKAEIWRDTGSRTTTNILTRNRFRAREHRVQVRQGIEREDVPGGRAFGEAARLAAVPAEEAGASGRRQPNFAPEVRFLVHERTEAAAAHPGLTNHLPDGGRAALLCAQHIQ